MPLRRVSIQPSSRNVRSARMTASRDDAVQAARSSCVIATSMRTPSSPVAPKRSASSTSRAQTRPTVSSSVNSMRSRAVSRSRRLSRRTRTRPTLGVRST
jgi:hypothetical protein